MSTALTLCCWMSGSRGSGERGGAAAARCAGGEVLDAARLEPRDAAILGKIGNEILLSAFHSCFPRRAERRDVGAARRPTDAATSATPSSAATSTSTRPDNDGRRDRSRIRIGHRADVARARRARRTVTVAYAAERAGRA